MQACILSDEESACGYHRWMFSYRHAFHAGNHADVLKHLTLVATVRHLMRKDSPLTLIDTHAGAGIYRLDADAAQTSGEALDGIGRLQGLAAVENSTSHRTAESGKAVAPALADYLGVVASFNRAPARGAAWRVYPGSPLIMHALMTEPARAAVHDRLKLFELHPTDIQALEAHVAQLGAGRQVSVARQDGFEALKALLPPPAAAGSRRALALIDPSYEIKSDYAKVGAAVQDALRRFATGVLLLWYPIIARPEAHALPRRLKTLAQQADRAWLHASLHIGAAPQKSEGLTASGMFVINPPHTLKAALDLALPQVLQTLGQDRGAGRAWTVESGP